MKKPKKVWLVNIVRYTMNDFAELRPTMQIASINNFPACTTASEAVALLRRNGAKVTEYHRKWLSLNMCDSGLRLPAQTASATVFTVYRVRIIHEGTRDQGTVT